MSAEKEILECKGEIRELEKLISILCDRIVKLHYRINTLKNNKPDSFIRYCFTGKFED